MTDNEIRRTFFRFLNEGKAEAFRDAYYPEIDDYILNKILEIDPMSNGDDLSDFGKLLLKLKPTHSDIQQAGQDVAVLAKAMELGNSEISLSEIKSLEDLHYLAVDIANEKGNMSAEEIQSQEISINCPVVYEGKGYKVMQITDEAGAEHYGKGTMWPWAANGANGSMFNELSQKYKIFVVKNESDGSLYSLVSMGKRVRITDRNDEPVDKFMFPQELIDSVMGLNEGILDFFKKDKSDPMIDKVVDELMSDIINGNINPNNDLGTAIARVKNAVGEADLESVIRPILAEKANEILADAERFGDGKMGRQQYMTIPVGKYPQILNAVADELENKLNNGTEGETDMNEGFMDKAGEFVQGAKDKMFGSDEDKGMLTDRIVESLVNYLKKLYSVVKGKQMSKPMPGFKGVMVKALLMLVDESQIESIMRPVLTTIVRGIIDDYPMLSAKNPQQCSQTVMNCLGGKGGFFNSASELYEKIQAALQNNGKFYESREVKTTTLNQKELDTFLKEALDKSMEKIIEERRQKALAESKKNKKMTVKLTESQMREFVENSVRKYLKESFSDLVQWQHFDNDRDMEDEEPVDDFIDCIDPSTLSNTLESCRWSYYDSKDVRDKQGREYVAYYCRPAGNSEFDFASVIEKVKGAAEMPNGIYYKEGNHTYAPEQKTYTIYVEIVPKENYGKQMELPM